MPDSQPLNDMGQLPLWAEDYQEKSLETPSHGKKTPLIPEVNSGWIDPLLTQPDQIGVGWARAIEPLLAHPGYNFSCAPTSGCQREEGADVGLESCFLPVGPESTFLGSA